MNGIEGKDVPATEAPNPEVVARPRRRRFGAKYKLDILAQADACKNEPGKVGELLRREGLYSSHLTEWRRQRDEGALRALCRKRGRKPNPDSELLRENERLRREIAKLEQRLERAEVVIDVQKKVSALLGIPLRSPENDGSDS